MPRRWLPAAGSRSQPGSSGTPRSGAGGGGLADRGTDLFGMQRHVQGCHAQRCPGGGNRGGDGRGGPDGSCLAGPLGGPPGGRGGGGGGVGLQGAKVVG